MFEWLKIDWLFSGIGTKLLGLLPQVFRRKKPPPSAIESAKELTNRSLKSAERRVTYIYHRARIALGDYHEFSEISASSPGRLRVYHKGLKEAPKYASRDYESEEKEPAPHLKVDIGGSVAVCIRPAREIDTNEIVVPVRRTKDPEAAIVCFYSGEQFFTFFKCCVVHLNVHTGEVEVEIGQAASSI